jgi:beta-lactam-binding protein with PASTA domain
MTVSLTSNNLHRLTTQNVHISSLIMRIKPQNEYISLNTQSMKPYPSSNTIVNEQSTIQTTISNQQTSFIPSSHQFTSVMMKKKELMTTIKDQERIQTSSNNQMTNVANSTLPTLSKSVFFLPFF